MIHCTRHNDDAESSSRHGEATAQCYRDEHVARIKSRPHHHVKLATLRHRQVEVRKRARPVSANTRTRQTSGASGDGMVRLGFGQQGIEGFHHAG